MFLEIAQGYTQTVQQYMVKRVWQTKPAKIPSNHIDRKRSKLQIHLTNILS